MKESQLISYERLKGIWTNKTEEEDDFEIRNNYLSYFNPFDSAIVFAISNDSLLLTNNKTPKNRFYIYSKKNLLTILLFFMILI